jgi:phage shock protein E
MKHLFLLLLVTALAGCSTKTVPSTAKAVVTTSAVAPGADASDSSQEFVIDVRSQKEWDSGHIEQAVHIPHTEIADRIAEVTDDKNAKIVLYCAVGGRAGTAKAKLEELGFTNVENGGGFDDMQKRYK